MLIALHVITLLFAIIGVAAVACALLTLGYMDLILTPLIIE